MPTVIKGAWVPGFGETDVLVEGSRIAQVGEVAERCGDGVIEGKGKALIPGLINTHGHAAMTLFRSVADDLPLMDWLQNKIWPLEAKLTPEDVYWGTMLAIAEMLKSGTTTFTDMYFFMDEAARAVEESGIRAVLSHGLIGVKPTGAEDIQLARNFARNWHGQAEGRITAMIGPHAPYTCPNQYLVQVIDLARELDLPLQIHLCETMTEVSTCREQHGVTPVELVNQVGFFDLPVLAAHCVHLTNEDIDILAANDVRIAHNPGSNLKLGSGIAPLPAMLAKGITVGLGSDGASSNNNLDMLEEMRLAALIHKGFHRDPELITAQQALDMATVQGARALFLDGEIGAVGQGLKADLILVNLEKSHLTPRHNPLAHLVYSARAEDVELVMVDGKILVEKGELRTIDEERIRFEAERAARRLCGR